VIEQDGRDLLEHDVADATLLVRRTEVTVG
jgi:hypothetical protein